MTKPRRRKTDRMAPWKRPEVRKGCRPQTSFLVLPLVTAIVVRTIKQKYSYGQGQASPGWVRASNFTR